MVDLESLSIYHLTVTESSSVNHDIYSKMQPELISKPVELWYTNGTVLSM